MKLITAIFVIVSVLFINLEIVSAGKYQACIIRKNEAQPYCSDRESYEINTADLLTPYPNKKCDKSYDALLCPKDITSRDISKCGCRRRPPSSVLVPVYINRTIEVPVTVYVDKIVYVDRIVDKPVYYKNCTDDVVEIPIYVNNCVNATKEVPVYIHNTVIREVPVYINNCTSLVQQVNITKEVLVYLNNTEEVLVNKSCGEVDIETTYIDDTSTNEKEYNTYYILTIISTTIAVVELFALITMVIAYRNIKRTKKYKTEVSRSSNEMVNSLIA